MFKAIFKKSKVLIFSISNMMKLDCKTLSKIVIVIQKNHLIFIYTHKTFSN